MSYTLIGSLTSPYVRRMRMVMENIPYALKELNIYDNAEGAEYLHKVNPVHQVPVLVDGDQSIWDSRVIFRYLNEKHKMETLSWEQENMLTAVEGALNSGIALFLKTKRSDMAIDKSKLVFQRHLDRMKSVLDYLKPHLASPAAKDWNFVNMTIYSTIDWMQFREMMDFSDRPECQKFLNLHSHRPVVTQTQIPK